MATLAVLGALGLEWEALQTQLLREKYRKDTCALRSALLESVDEASRRAVYSLTATGDNGAFVSLLRCELLPYVQQRISSSPRRPIDMQASTRPPRAAIHRTTAVEPYGQLARESVILIQRVLDLLSIETLEIMELEGWRVSVAKGIGSRVIEGDRHHPFRDYVTVFFAPVRRGRPNRSSLSSHASGSPVTAPGVPASP